jgi:dolichol-phosphate mannosyltransferase
MNVSIIIPVKNEEKTISDVIKKIRLKIKTDFETIIVYDNESDPTKSKAEQFIKDKKIKNFIVIPNEIGNKIGVINAIKTGIKHSHGKAIVITMADLSDDISLIDSMYSLIEKGYDIVAASRYMPGGKKIGGPFLKTFLSKTAGITLHYIFKLPTYDATNAYKMYRRSIFQNIIIESTGGFEYSLEIVLKAFRKGYKIIEIPTIWHDRQEGVSNFKLIEWLPKYIKTYFYVIRGNEK